MSTARAALPRWCLEILTAKPGRGGGLHRWLLKAAIAVRRCGLDGEEIANTLRDATACDSIRAGEIEEAVARSTDCMDNAPTASERPTTTAPTPHREAAAKWPAPDAALRAQVIAANGCTVADLWEASPVHFQDGTPHTDAIVRRLFPGNSLLCVAMRLEQSVTRPLESQKMLAMQQFIVPSPMSKPTGRTKDGRESPRCLDNVGPRRYLVVEQDAGESDEQAAVISHLSAFAPLVLVVHSGGKSLHAWFACLGQPEATVYAFFDHACRLGADPATWTRCQLVRMPDGARRVAGGFEKQFVLFWNPEAASCV